MNPTNRILDSSRSLYGLEKSAVWLAAIVGLSLSFAALLIIQQQLEAHKMLEFEWVARNRVRALNYGIDNSLLAVTTLRDHVMTSDVINPEGFRLFAESLLNRYGGIRALLWVPVVKQAERAEFEARSEAGGNQLRIVEQDGEYALTPAGERTEYFPVTLVVPEQGDDVPPGLDLGSIPSFGKTLQRARDTGRMAASGRFTYPRGRSAADHSFMAASPVFREGAAPGETGGQPQAALHGFVVGFFRLEDLTNAAVSLLEPRGVDILILDESAAADQRFLHFYASRVAPRNIRDEDFQAWWNNPDEPKVVEHIQLADRKLAIVCGRTEQFRSAEAFQKGSWIAMAAGLLFTVLLSFYLARIKENIKQRLIMERQLVEREELFRQMTETVDEAFWATTADDEGLLYFSPAFDKMLGVSEAGRWKSLLEVVYPEDRPLLAEALRRIRLDEAGTEVVHRVQRADGALRWMRTKGFPVKDERGVIYRLVGFLEDITERKLADETLRESEAKLRDLFQQSPDIIMTVDRRGKILLMNRSVPELPAERALGHNSLALMPRNSRKWFRKALNKVFRKGATQQFKYSADDGTYWEGRIVPIHGDVGPVTAAMVIAGDVTEKRNLEAQALHNARLASIGVLAAGVAHEINNPNNAIQFNASLVTRAWHDITPILREYYQENGDFALGGLSFSEARDNFPRLLSEITRNSERIRRIVQNLKHMSRQDTGELTENVDIQQVLEATLMILHNQIQKFTDICTLQAPDDLPTVWGNSQQLEQVFINVLLNALQALPDRSKGVHIHAGYNRQDEFLSVAFRDEGRGISKRDLGRLTEPFFTTRTGAGGTGLGLSISRSIVERHGGSIGFESMQGVGSTVTIRLPVTHPA